MTFTPSSTPIGRSADCHERANVHGHTLVTLSGEVKPNPTGFRVMRRCYSAPKVEYSKGRVRCNQSVFLVRSQPSPDAVSAGNAGRMVRRKTIHPCFVPPRSQRRVLHRGALRACGTVLTILVMTVGVGAYPTVAGREKDATSQSHLLQAVNVSLADDGSITSLTSTNITKTPNAITSSTGSYKPRKAGSHISVAVSVGFVADGKSGTDLSTLQGKHRVRLRSI